MNEKTENISTSFTYGNGTFDGYKISFSASDMNGQTVNIDAGYVADALGEVVENEDLSRFF